MKLKRCREGYSATDGPTGWCNTHNHSMIDLFCGDYIGQCERENEQLSRLNNTKDDELEKVMKKIVHDYKWDKPGKEELHIAKELRKYFLGKDKGVG